MDLFITGVIYDLSPLRNQIENAAEDVVLHIDSPGGDAFEDWKQRTTSQTRSAR